MQRKYLRYSGKKELLTLNHSCVLFPDQTFLLMHMHDPYSCIHNDLTNSSALTKDITKAAEYHTLFLPPFPLRAFHPLCFFYTYHALKANSVKVFSTIVPKNVCCTMWTWRTPILDFSYLFTNKKSVYATKKHSETRCELKIFFTPSDKFTIPPILLNLIKKILLSFISVDTNIP